MRIGHQSRLVLVVFAATLATCLFLAADPLWDPDLIQAAKLVPVVDLFEDNVMFGASVAVDGDLMVVGAPLENALAEDSGAAYVYVHVDDGWHLYAKLLPSDGEAFDEFGSSVAVDGFTVAVGAPKSNGPAGGDQGSAYVFVQSPDGQWTE